MKAHPVQFLGVAEQPFDLEAAKAVIVPFGYEGGVSYGHGTGQAPVAVLHASHYVELYDEVLESEPYRIGVATVDPGAPSATAGEMIAQIRDITAHLLGRDKFVIVIGGDHSISSGIAKAAAQRYSELGVVQFDAHADLRDTYDGSPLSHACPMARIREFTPHTLQLGIRSLSVEEADLIRKERLKVGFMHLLRAGRFDLDAALEQLPEHIFLTIDVDVFDWSVIRSTGTPEPGGLLWDEAMAMLKRLFDSKTVVGCDVVELAQREEDPNSTFAVAKLIYKLIGFKFARLL
jgi:agmatinase